MGICFLGTYFSVSLLFYTILTSTVLIIPITYALSYSQTFHGRFWVHNKRKCYQKSSSHNSVRMESLIHAQGLKGWGRRGCSAKVCNMHAVWWNYFKFRWDKDIILKWFFSTRQSPCFRNPCKNNATCVANYVDDDYQCVCSPGYMGEHCEGILKLVY